MIVLLRKMITICSFVSVLSSSAAFGLSEADNKKITDTTEVPEFSWFYPVVGVIVSYSVFQALALHIAWERANARVAVPRLSLFRSFSSEP